VLEPGLYEFEVPQADFKLRLSAPGYLDAELDNQGMALEVARLPEELTMELTLAPRLHGLVTAGGLAVAQARIEALPAAQSGTSLYVNGFPSLASPTPNASATSGNDGEFQLSLREPEPVYLRCVAEGFAPTMLGPFHGGGTHAAMEIALQVGGAIEGRALAQDGTPVVGAIVGITCGDGYPRTMRSGLGGVFRFEGLSEGRWLVLERPAELSDSTSTGFERKPQHIEWSCDVNAGKTTHFDLILKR
jgi:hypothetical protein